MVDLRCCRSLSAMAFLLSASYASTSGLRLRLRPLLRWDRSPLDLSLSRRSRSTERRRELLRSASSSFSRRRRMCLSNAVRRKSSDDTAWYSSDFMRRGRTFSYVSETAIGGSRRFMKARRSSMARRCCRSSSRFSSRLDERFSFSCKSMLACASLAIAWSTYAIENHL